MKKKLFPAFACAAAMLIACGDDSSSTSGEGVGSSSSNGTESSSSTWDHDRTGDFACLSVDDTTTLLRYSFNGPDSAMTVTNYVYPKVYEDVEKFCKEVQAAQTSEQKVTCDSSVAISYPPQIMVFDSLVSLMKEECYKETPVNAVDLIDPDDAPENGLWSKIKKAAKKVGGWLAELF